MKALSPNLYRRPTSRRWQILVVATGALCVAAFAWFASELLLLRDAKERQSNMRLDPVPTVLPAQASDLAGLRRGELLMWVAVRDYDLDRIHLEVERLDVEGVSVLQLNIDLLAQSATLELEAKEAPALMEALDWLNGKPSVAEQPRWELVDVRAVASGEGKAATVARLIRRGRADSSGHY